MSEIMEKIILDFVRNINKKKEDFIKESFKERGFEKHLEGLSDKMFPKVARQYINGWECWYAQDDNGEGIFIVAIRDKEPFFDLNYSDTVKMIQEFNYTKDISDLKR